MPKKNFILLSMEDEKIKKISNVISNDSCRKILDYLASKEATESELAAKLDIPISTVHYNLQQLKETSLIDADEYHYSAKGKEVQHYRLANKYIIIAPKKTFGIKEKLKAILPVALIAAGTAGVIQFISKYLSRTQAVSEDFVAKSAATERALEAAPVALTQAAPEAVVSIWQNIALWFFVGAVFALIVYFVLSMIRKDLT